MRGRINWRLVIGALVLLCAAAFPLAVELLDRLQPMPHLNLLTEPSKAK